MKIFKTKCAVISNKVAETQLKFSEMGIDSCIDDGDVVFVDSWIRYKEICQCEKEPEGENFVVTLKSGETLTCIDNPFEANSVIQVIEKID